MGKLVGKRKQTIFKKRWFDITTDNTQNPAWRCLRILQSPTSEIFPKIPEWKKDPICPLLLLGSLFKAMPPTVSSHQEMQFCTLPPWWKARVSLPNASAGRAFESSGTKLWQTWRPWADVACQYRTFYPTRGRSRLPAFKKCEKSATGIPFSRRRVVIYCIYIKSVLAKRWNWAFLLNFILLYSTIMIIISNYFS